MLQHINSWLISCPICFVSIKVPTDASAKIRLSRYYPLVTL